MSGATLIEGSVDISEKTRQVLAQIDRRLHAAGTDKTTLLFAMVWLVDVNRDIVEFNAAWSGWLSLGAQPARACVQAALQGTGAVEVAVLAAVTDRSWTTPRRHEPQAIRFARSSSKYRINSASVTGFSLP